MKTRIMTSNIWGDYFGNEVEGRDEQLFNIYKKYSPDVLGLQEMTKGWYASPIWETLSAEYSFVGADIFSSANYTPMLCKTEKFDLAEKGFLLFPETPDSSKSLTWAVLSDKESGKKAAFCNVHFMWKTGAEWDAIRVKNAECTVLKMRELAAKYGCPAFAFGDMNCTVTQPAFDYFRKEGIGDLFTADETAEKFTTEHGDPVRGADGKFHGKLLDEDFRSSIDHIVGIGEYSVKKYRLVYDADALDATDHTPVYADVEY